MKKLLIAGLLSVLMFAGCEILQNISFNDVSGQWKFDNTVINNHSTTAYIFVTGDTDDCRFDVWWEDENNQEVSFYANSGSMDGAKLTGTYHSGSDANTIYPITINFSLSGEKLKAVFSGQGSLDGLTFENGVPYNS